VFLNLNSPFGMALVGDDFYVANTDAIMKFPYHEGDTKDHRARRQACRPAGRPRSITTGPRTSSPVPTARSSTHRRLQQQCRRERHRGREGRAAIWKSIAPAANGACSRPACAIRTAWPGSRKTGALWVVVNERDELGNDLVPDYMTSVKDGAFYGWPYSYYGQHVDTRVEPQRPDLVAKAIAPDYALGAHTASLGLAFNTGNLFARRFAAAPSSASTARGIASPAPATR
jgi:glucose/arabinose dehydrogenase